MLYLSYLIYFITTLFQYAFLTLFTFSNHNLNETDLSTAMIFFTENNYVGKFDKIHNLSIVGPWKKTWINNNLVKCSHKHDKLHKQSPNSTKNKGYKIIIQIKEISTYQ